MRKKIQRWKTIYMLYKITIKNFCACTQKNFLISIKDLRLCTNNPALEGFVIQNHYCEFLSMYAKSFTASTKDLPICAKMQQLIILIQSSNNPIVDVLCPVQKLQVWNTYIPESQHIADPINSFSSFL